MKHFPSSSRAFVQSFIAAAPYPVRISLKMTTNFSVTNKACNHSFNLKYIL
jgi:hypothetical protein